MLHVFFVTTQIKMFNCNSFSTLQAGLSPPRAGVVPRSGCPHPPTRGRSLTVQLYGRPSSASPFVHHQNRLKSAKRELRKQTGKWRGHVLSTWPKGPSRRGAQSTNPWTERAARVGSAAAQRPSVVRQPRKAQHVTLRRGIPGVTLACDAVTRHPGAGPCQGTPNKHD